MGAGGWDAAAMGFLSGGSMLSEKCVFKLAMYTSSGDEEGRRRSERSHEGWEEKGQSSVALHAWHKLLKYKKGRGLATVRGNLRRGGGVDSGGGWSQWR